MTDLFLKRISQIYNSICRKEDTDIILSEIKALKKELQLSEISYLGEYYSSISLEVKGKGRIYTPNFIANFMIHNTIKKEDILRNPYMKILDPSGGCGNFLLPCYNYLYNIYWDNLEIINIKKEEIPKHIIEHNMFYFDVDEIAARVFSIDLYTLSGYIATDNIKVEDYLVNDHDGEFDIIIGNPPYIGHKVIDRKYSMFLKERYSVYIDKGDISYCFFYKAFLDLKEGGKLSFITSRYFIESPSGGGIRSLINSKFNINLLVDFYGLRPFKNVAIDPLMIFLRKKPKKNNIFTVIKPKSLKSGNGFYSCLNNNNIKEGEEIKNFKVNQDTLRNSGWILREEMEMRILNKIEDKCEFLLGDICESFQGIITGCDRAFIVDEKTILEEGLERDIIRPWIKSTNITLEGITKKDSFILYSDAISEESLYQNAIRHIEVYKDRLSQRRECKSGLRKWYQLQWGRKIGTFEQGKIIFPYKSSRNIFCYDKGSFYSADVYSLKIREDKPFTYKYILFLLNSSIYDFYFKTYGKKLGDKQYEYYPSYVMRLLIPAMEEGAELSEEYLYKLFGLSNAELEIIRRYRN